MWLQKLNNKLQRDRNKLKPPKKTETWFKILDHSQLKRKLKIQHLIWIKIHFSIKMTVSKMRTLKLKKAYNHLKKKVKSWVKSDLNSFIRIKNLQFRDSLNKMKGLNLQIIWIIKLSQFKNISKFLKSNRNKKRKWILLSKFNFNMT